MSDLKASEIHPNYTKTEVVVFCVSVCVCVILSIIIKIQTAMIALLCAYIPEDFS